MSPDTRYLVYGPPGTGKTTFLKDLIRKCADQYGPETIIAESFSKTAALEIGTPREGEDKLPIPDNHIGTMHSLCFHQLGLKRDQMTAQHMKDFAEKHGKYAISVTQQRAQDLDEPETDATYETYGDEMLGAYTLLRSRMVPRDQWPQSVANFAAAWDGWKKEAGLFDFSDLIEVCLTSDYYQIPFSASVLIGDEHQDLTPLQHALFAKWASHASYTVAAGDDDQLIYGHTGATAAAFLDATVPDDHKRVLEQSRRVPRRVQAVANAWIEGVSQRQPKEYAPRAEDGLVRVLNGSYKNPEMIINDAAAQVKAGRSVMILASCSYMLQPVIHALRFAGVPFHNPYRRSRGDWNPLHTRGYSMSDRLLALLRPSGGEHGIEERFWTWRDLDALVEVMAAEGVTQRGAKKEIDGRAHDDMMRYQEVDGDALLHLLEPEAMGELITGNVEYFIDHMLPAKRDTMRFPLAILKSHGAKALEDTPRLVVGTIHSVKGTEADVVYLIPDLSTNAARARSRSIEGADAVYRQFYVGLTRAREELIACLPATKDYAMLPVKAGMARKAAAA